MFSRSYFVIFFLICSVQCCWSWRDALRKLMGTNCYKVERGIDAEYYICLGCVIQEAQACLEDFRLNKSANLFYGCNFPRHYGGKFYPTKRPVTRPTPAPSHNLTSAPTSSPTRIPTYIPGLPVPNPTAKPTTSPSLAPTLRPTFIRGAPTPTPTGTQPPTTRPSTLRPTYVPTKPNPWTPSAGRTSLYGSMSERVNKKCCPHFGYDRKGRHDLLYSSAGYPMVFECIKKAGCADSLIYQELETECVEDCTDPDPRTGGSSCHATFNSAPLRFSTHYIGFAILALSYILLSC